MINIYWWRERERNDRHGQGRGGARYLREQAEVLDGEVLVEHAAEAHGEDGLLAHAEVLVLDAGEDLRGRERERGMSGDAPGAMRPTTLSNSARSDGGRLHSMLHSWIMATVIAFAFRIRCSMPGASHGGSSRNSVLISPGTACSSSSATRCASCISRSPSSVETLADIYINLVEGI